MSGFAQAWAGPQPVVTPSGLTIEHQWTRGVLGEGIGLDGLRIADVDADGTTEVVVSSRMEPFWYILSRSGADYVQEWVSPAYASEITSLRVAQLDGDAALEVLVATAGQVQVYDGATRTLQQLIPRPSGIIRNLNVADVDADGARELVFTQGAMLYVVDATTGLEEAWVSGLGEHDVTVGQLDGDAALEIVVANGYSPGSVVDGLTRAVEWSQPSGLGSLVRVADLDGDGLDDIVAGFASSRGLRVYRGGTYALAYQVPVFNMSAVQVADVEGNGSLELVYGDAQWGGIHVLSGATGAELWTVSNPRHGVTDIAVGNVDEDPARELLWATGATSSGSDFLFVADAATHAREWQSKDERGPFFALTSGDVDGDGRRELLSGSFQSELIGGGRYAVHDATTGTLKYLSEPIPASNGLGLWRIRSANVDDDPQQEVFVAFNESNNGTLIARDGVTHAEQWRVTVPNGLSLRALELVDLDADGTLEVVSSTGTEYPGAPAPTVYVHDAATGALEWQGPALTGTSSAFLSLLRVANVDADAALEILVAHHGGSLWVIDSATRAIQATTEGLGITALDTADVDGDGRKDIIVGTSTGLIGLLDAASGSLVQSLASTLSQVDGLSVLDVTGDGMRDFVFASGNRLHILNGATGQEEWASEVLGAHVGAQDSLRVEDVDGDGLLEVVVNRGPMGFIVYELRLETPAPSQVARYDAALKAPLCSTVGASCDSGGLLVGRGPLGPEGNAPNTLGGLCADGSEGLFHEDESNDRIRVSTLDGTSLAAGKTVRIDATVWAWLSPVADRLDLYFAADANNPSWQYLTTLTPATAGEQVLSATYVLPSGPLQTVRARFRYGGSPAACLPGGYDDHDDLIFAVR